MDYLGMLLIFAGLLFVSGAIDNLAKQVRRANELKEAELSAAGVAVAN